MHRFALEARYKGNTDFDITAQPSTKALYPAFPYEETIPARRVVRLFQTFIIR